MSKRKLLQQAFGFMLAVMLLVGCGGAPVGQIPAPTETSVPPAPAPTGTSLPPTPAPTETSVPPTLAPTETAVPPTPAPTETAVPPTDTPTPEIIPASQESITAHEFEFQIVQLALDESISGFVPNSMGSSDQILLLEFELIAGRNEAFANLMPVILLESGQQREAVAWGEDKSFNTMTLMTFTGAASEFSLGETSVTLVYVVPRRNPGTLLLEFPSGVLIDLTPLMPE